MSRFRATIDAKIVISGPQSISATAGALGQNVAGGAPLPPGWAGTQANLDSRIPVINPALPFQPPYMRTQVTAPHVPNTVEQVNGVVALGQAPGPGEGTNDVIPAWNNGIDNWMSLYWNP